MLDARKILVIVVIMGLIILTTLIGTILALNWLLYTTIGLICAGALLVCTKPQGRCVYPAFLYIAALSLVFQMTLFSPYLIGGDIHLEYYFAQRTLGSGWDPSIPLNQNSALSITLLVPGLARILGIDPLWILKVIVPLVFALVPVILWYIYSRFMEERDAFIACIFFISVPTFFIEIPAIARQQITEVALCFFVAIAMVINWRLRWKIAALIITGVLIILLHYSLGGLFIAYVGLVAATMYGLRLIKLKGRLPVWLFTVIAIVVIIVGVCYYGTVSSGVPLRDLLGGIPFINIDLGSVSVGLTSPQPPSAAPDSGLPPSGIATDLSLFLLHTPMMKMALGMDFFEVDTWGQIFRVLQMFTQVLLVIGTAYFVFWFRRHRFPSEYLAFVLVSCLLLLTIIIRPQLSAVINGSRFYHVTLIFIAPMIIFGGRLLFKRSSIVLACLILPYLIFTSGAVFELTKQDQIVNFEMPYSIALSSHRFDLWGNFTTADEEIRDYIVSKRLQPVYADLYGSLFLQEKLGYLYPLYPLPHNVADLPKDAYIYLRDYNDITRTVTYWVGPGMRESLSYAEVGLCSVLNRRPVIIQSSNAMLIGGD